MIATGDFRDAGHQDLLGAIRDLYETIDPMPPGLPDRIRLALRSATSAGDTADTADTASLDTASLDAGDLDAEIARLVSDAGELAPAARGTEESRTVTFDSDSLTIMIRVEANPDGTARVDGWLAPPQPRQVEVKMTGGSVTVTADEAGRFVVESVLRGSAQLVVKPLRAGTPDGSVNPVNGTNLVITPAMTLLSGE